MEQFVTYPKERVIPFEGVQNFRDMGGYETKDGRKVKHGLFFRSAELSGLTDKDRAFFETLGIKTIYDYRTDAEAIERPNPVFESILNKRIPPITDLKTVVRSVDDMTGSELVNHLNEGSLYDFYQSIIFDNPSYKKLMNVIQDPNNLAIVNHCTAGKDRTGVGSALILLALDVPEETVMQDYLLSNQHLSRLVNRVKERLSSRLTTEQLELVDPFMSIKKEYLEGVFAAIKKVYGNFDTFFIEEFDLTTKKREDLQRFCLK